MTSLPFRCHFDAPTGSEPIASFQCEVAGWLTAAAGCQVANLELVSLEGNCRYPLVMVDRPDVAAAFPDCVAMGFRGHFLTFELPIAHDWQLQFSLQGVAQSVPLPLEIDAEFRASFARKKAAKLARVRPLLRCTHCGSGALEDQVRDAMGQAKLYCPECQSSFGYTGDTTGDTTGYFDFLDPAARQLGAIEATENVSSWGYDPIAQSLIDRHAGGMILDNGCGFKSFYDERIINFEIAPYPTTDVLGIGELLPFQDNSFDLVFSLLVLEHVRDPWACAREIQRVLKPGGTLYAIVPFLQPFHGYPNHYYNMSASGLKNLFADGMSLETCQVHPKGGLPIATLTWFLQSYVRGLPPEVAATFKSLSVADLLNHHSHYLERDFVRQLHPTTNEELACSNYLIATKTGATLGG